jgi:hypothetical protein
MSQIFQHPDCYGWEDIASSSNYQTEVARDVVRAFGTLPPHKTKSFRKKDSIVDIGTPKHLLLFL